MSSKNVAIKAYPPVIYIGLFQGIIYVWKIMATDRDWGQCDELIEACMEWIGQHWTKSMIKRQIRKIADDKQLTDKTCIGIINKAYDKIRTLYGIDPQDFKGIQIEFYRTIIRKKEEKTHNKLTASARR